MQSCSVFNELFTYKKPKVTLEEIKFKAIDFNKFNLHAKIKVKNRNIFDIKFSEFVYKVVINEEEVAEGKNIGITSIRSHTAQSINLAINIKNKKILSLITRSLLTKNKNVKITLSSKLKFHSPVGIKNIALSETKRISL